MRRSLLRGFTLVETIFSTLFISLTVLAIVNLFPGAYLSVKKSETRLQSDYIAQSVIEDLRNIGVGRLTPGDYYAVVTSDAETQFVSLTTRGDWDTEYANHGHSVDDIRYLVLVTVSDEDGLDPEIVKGVSVEVEYVVGSLTQSNLHETYLHVLY